MSKTTFAVYKCETENTTPRGFGFKPTYHLDKVCTSEKDMIWITEILCTLPEGYLIAECVSGTTELYNERGQRVEIVDDHGHPAVEIENGTFERIEGSERSL